MSAVDDVDRVLASWTERLRRVDDNLLALEGEATYEALAGSSGERASLEGVSAERVSPALAALSELFEQRQHLNDVLERAKEIRASMSTLSFWENDAKAKDVRELFDGPSIRMELGSAPLSRRGLLDRAEREIAVSPEQLLADMVRAFERARDAVLAVKNAWARLEPSLARMEQEVLALRALAERVGETASARAELDAVDAALGRARARVARDPLGATDDVENALAPRIAEVRAALTARSAQRERVERDLARAAEMRRALRELHERTRAALAAARRELAGTALPDAITTDMLDGLDAWRETLRATADARRWSSVAVGLARWITACESYAQTDARALAACEALGARKTELEGRLSARAAQAEALVARGAVRPAELDALARAAREALARRPLPLDAAQTAVDAFEGAVIELAKRR